MPLRNPRVQHSDMVIFKEENVILRGGAQCIQRFRPVPCFIRHTAKSNLFPGLFQVAARVPL